MKITRTASALFACLALGACVQPLAEAAPAVTPLPRISFSSTGFTKSSTGAAFILRGTNYLRLHDSGGVWYLSHFEPGQYDGNAMETMLKAQVADGNNVVRIFIDEGRPLDSQVGDLHGIGRGTEDERSYDPAYMDNVADFVKRAIANKIYVIPVTYRFPQNCFYFRIVQGNGTCSVTPRTPNIEGRNALFMDTGYVAAKREYLKQFSTGLLSRIGQENSSVIIAYEAENEAYYPTNKLPWSMSSGTITPSDGGTYDMSIPSERQQAADATLVRYTLEAKAGLLEGDPNGKLMMGFYGHQAVGKGDGPSGLMTSCSTACDVSLDYRYPARGLIAAMYGAVDVVDIHLYPRAGTYDVASDLRSAEAHLITNKPWFIGELGAFRDVYANDPIAAGNGMRSARAASCGVGAGAKGALGWTWDTQDNDDQRRLFTSLDPIIRKAFSTKVQPNMCKR